YDTVSLCFAIYAMEPNQLRRILHLHKIHKRGAARMIMKNGPRRPQQPLDEFFTQEKISPILEAFDTSQRDGRTGELMNIMVRDDHHIVFIRRCFRSSFIVGDRGLVHGYQPEWIVLDFFDGAKRVNISSNSVAESLEIANRI